MQQARICIYSLVSKKWTDISNRSGQEFPIGMLVVAYSANQACDAWVPVKSYSCQLLVPSTKSYQCRCKDNSNLGHFGPFGRHFVGVQKHALVTNFINLGLRLGNRFRVRVSIRVRASIRFSVSGPMCPRSEVSQVRTVCTHPCHVVPNTNSCLGHLLPTTNLYPKRNLD